MDSSNRTTRFNNVEFDEIFHCSKHPFRIICLDLYWRNDKTELYFSQCVVYVNILDTWRNGYKGWRPLLYTLLNGGKFTELQGTRHGAVNWIDVLWVSLQTLFGMSPCFLCSYSLYCIRSISLSLQGLIRICVWCSSWWQSNLPTSTLPLYRPFEMCLPSTRTLSTNNLSR